MKKKIQVPWADDHEDIVAKREAQTNEYWLMSGCWNGRVAAPLTVSDVIDKTAVILREVNPATKLAGRVAALKEDVIIHGSKRLKIKHDRLEGVPERKGKMIVL